ncbi:MAG: protein TolQ [Thermodesulfovibrionales bacterium]|nr:protein TolQ [Thermodesulfovibrionales bacterium]
MENSVLTLILNAGYVVKGVLAVLMFFSVVSWAIIFFKRRHLSQAKKETAQFMRAYMTSKDLKELLAASKRLNISPIANVFKAVSAEPLHRDTQEVRRMLRRYEALETAKLDRHLNFLATTGSTTPFIGLFGTVWGIMNSFRGIGAAGSASLAVVAPGIAEALIATALGLLAAIPAVIAYNYYLSRVRGMIIEMEDFSEDLLELFLREGR